MARLGSQRRRVRRATAHSLPQEDVVTVEATSPAEQSQEGGAARLAGTGSDYARLSRIVRAHGLLGRRRGYYGVKIGVNLLLLASGWAVFGLLGRSWWQLLIAVFLAVMFTQTGFIGHDAGHRQISGSKRADDMIGRIHGNLLIGLSYGWWTAKHNRHHARPNQVGRDPDIGGRAIAFTAGQARARRGIGSWLAGHQAWLFFPMLLLEGIHLHVAGVRTLLARRGTTVKVTEAVLLGIHMIGYLVAVFLVLSPIQAVAFLLVQQGLFGAYLGCSFAPNHKGMPVLAEDDDLDFLRRQVITSRNIRGGWVTDFVLGGLNYQIEHHLFPSMPRPTLRRAQEPVRAFCEQHGIAYHQTGLVSSYVQVLRHLHAVGGSLRPELEY
jgi:fatty acid desaturase